MEAVSWRLGEKLAFRGKGLGPCTAHETLIVDERGMRDLAVEGGASSSRKALPLAEAIRPVCRTDRRQCISNKNGVSTYKSCEARLEDVFSVVVIIHCFAEETAQIAFRPKGRSVYDDHSWHLLGQKMEGADGRWRPDGRVALSSRTGRTPCERQTIYKSCYQSPQIISTILQFGDRRRKL